MSTPSSVADAGEHTLIELIRRRVPPYPSWVSIGIGDDAAVVEPERNLLEVLTTDALIDGVHFDRRFTPPAAIGHRALAANLSDLAAMGAHPRVALLSLMLPPELLVDDLTAMVDGLLSLAARHKVALVGGNITRTTGPLTVDLTVTGSVHRRRVLTRAGARPGDEVWVSGGIGAAAAGLLALKAGRVSGGTDGASCETAWLYPEPRLRLGALLGRNRAATTCVDLSDGLADGLQQLAAASQVGMVVDGGALPVPAAARAWFETCGLDPVDAALRGGDDYELLFTVNPKRRSRMRTVRQGLGELPLTKIGLVTAAPAVVLNTPAGTVPVPAGYEHFR